MTCLSVRVFICPAIFRIRVAMMLSVYQVLSLAALAAGAYVLSKGDDEDEHSPTNASRRRRPGRRAVDRARTDDRAVYRPRRVGDTDDDRDGNELTAHGAESRSEPGDNRHSESDAAPAVGEDEGVADDEAAPDDEGEQEGLDDERKERN